jgi:hypothetical protein
VDIQNAVQMEATNLDRPMSDVIIAAATLLAIALSSCAQKPPPPLDVSQSSMNLAMLQRIKNDGAAACSAEGGLKGITWPFDTIPNDGFGEGPSRMVQDDPYSVLVLPYDKLPKKLQGAFASRDQYETNRQMKVLAETAPEKFKYHGGSGFQASPADYVCTSGVVVASKTFRFLP